MHIYICVSIIMCYCVSLANQVIYNLLKIEKIKPKSGAPPTLSNKWINRMGKSM